MNEKKLQVVCVLKTGGDYDAHHVDILRAHCTKFLPPHRFICISDNKSVPDRTRFIHNWPGWWSKMEIFGPRVPDAPTLYIDLDTVIVANCDDLIASVTGLPFVILRDVIRGTKNPKAMQSSVMFWSSRPAGVYEKFLASPEQHMLNYRGDQDFLETVIPPSICSYWQDYSDGLSSFKVDVQHRGLLPKDRMVIFHGRPRPWQQTMIPYEMIEQESVHVPIKPNLALRSGWVVPTDDKEGHTATLAAIGDVKIIINACKMQRRTAIQAGGNIGVWPVDFAKAFKRVISFEPDSLNFSAMAINTAGVANLEIHNAALSDAISSVGMVTDPRNIGAHYITPNGTIPAVTIDSLGIEDCDLIQLDIEGAEHFALLGARATIEKSHPVIVLEMKQLGRRFGHSDSDTVAMLRSWGYVRTGSMRRDVIFTHHSAPGAEPQKAALPAVDYCPIPAGQSCVLVGNGPSVLSEGMGSKIDAFDQVCRFNQYKIVGFENQAGSKTTLWATFGRGMLPHDGAAYAPERVIYIHGNTGDPAVQAKELWRIDRNFFWSVVEGWKDEKGGKGNQLLPSTGYLVASWLLEFHKVPKLWLAGFDHFSKAKTGMHHYWNPKSYKRPPEHDGDREAATFARWESEGRVCYLK